MSFVSGICTGNSYWEGETVKIVLPFKHKGRRRKAKKYAYGIFVRVFKAHA